MKYIVIEDEEPAAARLVKLVHNVAPQLELEKHLVSVKGAISYLVSNKHPDVIFMDIRLADGDSFEIFKSVEPDCPVIFVTAYDQYAITAFKVNSIGYLLKPVKSDELKLVIDKFLKTKEDRIAIDYKSLAELVHSKTLFQQRFLVRFGDQLKTILVSDIAYFYTENKINYLRNFEGHDYPVDQTLDQLEAMVDPAQFFRVNRQFIVGINAIKKMVSYSKSRVKLILEPIVDSDLIVSTNRSSHFKSWLSGTHSL